MKKLAIVLVLASVLTGCKKEEISNPAGNDLACYECNTYVIAQDSLGVQDTLSNIKSIYCSVTSLKIANMGVEYDRWVLVNGVSGKQSFICKKR